MSKVKMLLLSVFMIGVLVLSIYSVATSGSNTDKEAMFSAHHGTQGDPVLSGKVVETMDAASYTYLCIENKGTKTWLAIPKTTVIVGQNVSCHPGQKMVNFASKTLNRTFPEIYFSSGLVDSETKAPGSAKSTVEAEKNVTVKAATVKNGVTVADLYAKIDTFDQKAVTINGKVVKVSKNIMGKNWLHLQDGTGDAGKGTHDLVVTSNQLAAVGDMVTITGKAYKDKDFGHGYRYAVIVEEATLTPLQ